MSCMISTIGNLRGGDLRGDDDGELGQDEVRLGDVLGSDRIGEIAEGLTILNATGFEKQGVDLLLAILEQGFEFGGDVEALGGSDRYLGESGSKLLGLFRCVDAGHNLGGEHANRFGYTTSAEHCGWILGPSRPRLGGQ